MKIMTPEGVVSGRSYSEVVSEMARSKFCRPRNRGSYRRAVARRARVVGMVIDPTDDAAFVRSGIKAGLFMKVGA